MQNQSCSDEMIIDLILSYSDGSYKTFTLSEAVRFHQLLKTHPGFGRDAHINREIRLKLQSLPQVGAVSGFEARLAAKIAKEEE